ncbi:MAG: RND family transporter [Bacteroidales bacterium]|nr:RND family transporter [Bacteroidales bacterium]
MNKISERIIKYRLLIVLLTLGITAFLGYQITNLKMDSDIINSLPDNDSTAVLYKNIGNEFGGNSMGMVILQTKNIFKASVLEDVKRVTDSLQLMPGISTVTSLTNIIEIRGGDFGIDVGHLLDEYDLPKTQPQLDSLAKRVMSKEMYKGNIVSPDSTSTIVMFKLQEGVNKELIAKKIKDKIGAMHLSEKVYFAGTPIMMDDMSNLMRADMTKLLPVTFIVIMLILFLSFGTIRGVIMPLLSSGISIVWVLGLMHLMGYHLDLITNELPIVLLAVGSAYTIHVINRINEERGKDRKKAMIRALTYIIIPVFLSGITTVFGFASFIFGAYLTMIKNFGIFTSLGVIFALGLSLVFVPAFIALLNFYRKDRAKKTKEKKESLLSRWMLKPLSRTVLHHPKAFLWVVVALILISSIGIFRIRTSVDMMSYFQKGNQTRVSERIMQKEFGGSSPVFVVFKGDMQNPEVLKSMMATEDYMKRFPDISTTQSVADLIEEMNNVMGEGKRIPDTKIKIQQLWFLLEGQDIMSQLVNHDLNKGIIQSRFASSDSKQMEEFAKYMNQYIKKHSTPQCQIELTGMPSVYVKMNNSLIRSQFTSLSLAILLVIFIVGLILKSFKKGFYAAIPIFATIIILFGFMGFAGIALDIATVLVASVALGMGIDYSIHIITHFYNDLKETHDVEAAINETIRVSGKAIIINVASVAAGFLVLLFSHIVPIQNFGLLVALSMAGSGFAALTILPILLILNTRKQNKIKN